MDVSRGDQTMKQTLLLLWVALLVLVAVPVFAQDDETVSSEPLSAQIAELQQSIEAATVDAPTSPSRSADVPQGINILIVMAAVGAIASIGLAMIGKESNLASSGQANS
jgi:hypothetical protein